ncbi:F510_1955 family glycosylhydrolase [Oceanobacillus sp. CF4.6]|uniref:F510_1955 family glycosylhydrolase n=1 Tax=Oceanobacillus sp. CF4.6 TaxID=3373080 RepID=UPI003EE4EA9C
MMLRMTIITVTIIVGIFLAGCSNNQEKDYEVAFDGTVDHVHGMGYAGINKGLYFATHTGLKIFRNGDWYETTRNFNDYMGFNAVDEGFYTSGHPGEDSDLQNPIGIQHSFDGGRTLEHLKFEGETDFHAMAVGYNSHDIFLMNPAKNSELEQGFYRSSDEGESWENVSASGLTGEILSLAIHPSNSSFVAAATSTGIYLSEDGGNNFQIVTEGNDVGTAVFSNDDHLYYASYGSIPELVKRNVENGEEETIDIPEFEEDGVVYIAQNPQDENQLAIYTTKGHAYLSEDGTKTWEQILENGQVK